MDIDRYRGQFILTQKADFFSDWNKVAIGGYYLYYHNDLVFTRSVYENKELILLGSL